MPDNPEYVITVILKEPTAVTYMFFPDSNSAYTARRDYIKKGYKIRFGKYDESFAKAWADSGGFVESLPLKLWVP
jgi:hypothetical protein